MSDHGYVFVEDAQWTVTMNQTDVDTVLNTWDTATPAGSIDPTKGIFEIETELYGGPPDIDGWPGIVLLYYDMGCYMGQCFDGFFRSLDETNDPHSNQMDMLFLDPVHQDPGSDYMFGVMAHEFNHMIQYTYDPNEEIWLSESLAEAAMVVTGYPTDLAWLDDFVQHPSTTFWDDGTSVNYGAALLMGTYLYERGGIDLLQAITKDPAHGEGSVEAQLQALGVSANFPTFFGDLATAIAADHFTPAVRAADPYQFTLLDVGELNWTDTFSPGFDAQSIPLAVPAGALVAYRFDVTGAGQAAVVFPQYEADDLELGLIAVGGQIAVERRDAASSDWPNMTFDLGSATPVLLVLANPTNADSETSAQVTFAPGAADDDTADDDAVDDDAVDDDATDDDATDDDAGDDSGGDNGGGCGC